MRKEAADVRFWRFVDKNGPRMPHMSTNCWTWTGCKDGRGYGRFNEGPGRDQRARAHRVSIVMAHGPIPADRPIVCHHCDNPSCVRPDHLYCGTASDNARDGYAHGQFRRPPDESKARGEKHGSAKLSWDVVEEIRRTSGSIALAKKYGVNTSTIRRIRSGQLWNR